jgi:hypothetical protein
VAEGPGSYASSKRYTDALPIFKRLAISVAQQQGLALIRSVGDNIVLAALE